MGVDLGNLPTWLAAVGGIGAGIAALRQLGLQRKQLAEQQTAILQETALNRKRDELLDRQLRAADRRLAEKVETNFTRSDQPPPGITVNDGDSVYAVRVFNGSDRPIRAVAAAIKFDQEQPQPASAYRRLTPHPPRTGPAYGYAGTVQDSRVKLIIVGDRYEFVFPYSVTENPTGRMVVRFTDDAELYWQVDQDLHLELLYERAW